MAYAADLSAYGPARPLARLAEAIIAVVEKSARLQGRRDRFEELSALSDEELQRQGIKREDIAHHVFRDLYYI
ncbi:hypothetical protein EU803_01110 [Loktanella sp. IMCC34160]|uniref:hypothetical protein n=1 Tax=Loktanella sp. IMCC34160 TaxID=2510646 RepID=UPI00101CFF0C|nr:hypothetical protein [Loktanella sp. IMCC34160]RYG92735.1 hypothetical protein EU803_01110 [Loktanella sp. IMCC34160]